VRERVSEEGGKRKEEGGRRKEEVEEEWLCDFEFHEGCLREKGKGEREKVRR
jgi:hypothetical protein